MEIDQPTVLVGPVIAIDPKSFCYRACSLCEKTLPEDISNASSSSLCRHWDKRNAFSPASKRLYRVLMSIASDMKVFRVIMFDRAARVLFGCSADEFFDFVKLHPSSDVTAAEILEGEMLRVILSKPKNGNAQHLRVASVVPLRTGFQPALVTLKELYGERVAV